MFVLLETVDYEVVDRFISLHADEHSAIMAGMRRGADFFTYRMEPIYLVPDTLWTMTQGDKTLEVRKVEVK